MGYKITYKDGKVEDLKDYSELEVGDTFVEFAGEIEHEDEEDEDLPTIMISKDLIAKIE